MAYDDIRISELPSLPEIHVNDLLLVQAQIHPVRLSEAEGERIPVDRRFVSIWHCQSPAFTEASRLSTITQGVSHKYDMATLLYIL